MGQSPVSGHSPCAKASSPEVRSVRYAHPLSAGGCGALRAAYLSGQPLCLLVISLPDAPSGKWRRLSVFEALRTGRGQQRMSAANKG